jgi:hypothetical protein
MGGQMVADVLFKLDFVVQAHAGARVGSAGGTVRG